MSPAPPHSSHNWGKESFMWPGCMWQTKEQNCLCLTSCGSQVVVQLPRSPSLFHSSMTVFLWGNRPKLHVYLGFERSCWMAITRIQRGLVAWELPTQDFRWETLPNCRAVLIQQPLPSLNISWFQRESWLRGWHCSADVYSKAPLSCLVSLKTRTLPPPLLCAF